MGKEDFTATTAAVLGEAAEVDPHRHGHPSLTGCTKPFRIIRGSQEDCRARELIKTPALAVGWFADPQFGSYEAWQLRFY